MSLLYKWTASSTSQTSSSSLPLENNDHISSTRQTPSSSCSIPIIKSEKRTLNKLIEEETCLNKFPRKQNQTESCLIVTMFNYHDLLPTNLAHIKEALIRIKARTVDKLLKFSNIISLSLTNMSEIIRNKKLLIS